ncbi:hypothetical protein OCAR_7433 [Afipia carboxidovorans OM5]|nr:hypothetical protein OCAR_7433 [Afipia carboxidovorans OM5]
MHQQAPARQKPGERNSGEEVMRRRRRCEEVGVGKSATVKILWL